ncbi:MAG TPA: glycosyltransferase family 4 protein [Bacteroidales bacterium]|nr:glycosyltransferase family 4 protein [Bacteroidales bacterium]HPS50613.1 glycosyltransferase family 4 protein [Bacteroidales bacterium]
MKIKLAIITSHPIQYNAPMFALLAQSGILDIKVFYTWSQSRESFIDKDFGTTIKWDIPLLEGYEHTFVENVSKNPGPGTYSGIVCPSLNREISTWGAQALLVYGWKYHAHYNAMRYYKGRIPVCFRGDSTLIDDTGGMKQAIRHLVLRQVYRKVDYAFYVGENNRRYYLQLGFNDEHLFFAPHAVDNYRFGDPTGEMKLQADQWRNELSIGQNDIVVLFAGKFEQKKNPELLMQAALELNKPGIHFLFAGNGFLEPALKELASGNPSIHFIPFQNQSRMPVVYHLSDILVLPSRGPEETWGLVVNEAMACGKAILVSDRCGCAIDLVKPGQNGYIFRSDDREHCRTLLDIMTESREQTRKMGESSLKIIAAWSYEAVCKSFETHLPDLVK